MTKSRLLLPFPTEEVQKVFNDWIDRPTWDSRHYEDERRFLIFAKSWLKYSTEVPGKIDLKGIIILKWGHSKEESANKFSSKLDLLFDYEFLMLEEKLKKK